MKYLLRDYFSHTSIVYRMVVGLALLIILSIWVDPIKVIILSDEVFVIVAFWITLISSFAIISNYLFVQIQFRRYSGILSIFEQHYPTIRNILNQIARSLRDDENRGGTTQNDDFRRLPETYLICKAEILNDVQPAIADERTVQLIGFMFQLSIITLLMTSLIYLLNSYYGIKNDAVFSGFHTYDGFVSYSYHYFITILTIGFGDIHPISTCINNWVGYIYGIACAFQSLFLISSGINLAISNNYLVANRVEEEIKDYLQNLSGVYNIRV